MFLAKKLDLLSHNTSLLFMRLQDAKEFGLQSGERVKVSAVHDKSNSIVCLVEIIESSSLALEFDLKKGQIGLDEESYTKLNFKSSHKVLLAPAKKAISLSYITQRFEQFVRYTYQQLYEIVFDIQNNNYDEREIEYFVLSCIAIPLSDREVHDLSRALLINGKQVDVRVEKKQKLFGLAGVYTQLGDISSLLAYPLAAASGVTLPYVFGQFESHIDSLCDTSLTSRKFQNIMREHNLAFVDSSLSQLAPVADMILAIEHPLELQDQGLIIACLLAKASSVGLNKLIVDITYGLGSKLKTHAQAKLFAKRFTTIARKVKVKLVVQYSHNLELVAAALGTQLEIKELFKILENSRYQSLQLRDKACELAGLVMEQAKVVKKGLGSSLAQSMLDSQKALKKFEEVISAQDHRYQEKDPVHELAIKSRRKGRVNGIDQAHLSSILNALGIDYDDEAGIILRKKTGNPVEKGDTLFEIYSSSELKLKYVKEHLEELDPYIVH